MLRNIRELDNEYVYIILKRSAGAFGDSNGEASREYCIRINAAVWGCILYTHVCDVLKG